MKRDFKVIYDRDGWHMDETERCVCETRERFKLGTLDCQMKGKNLVLNNIHNYIGHPIFYSIGIKYCPLCGREL